MEFLLIMAFSTAFKTWLATENVFRNYVAKLQAHDGSSVVTLYVSSEPFQTLSTDTPSAEHVFGGLDEDEIRAWLSGNNPWSHDTGGAGTGRIVIHDPAGDLDDWVTYNFRDYDQEILLGGPDLGSGLVSDYERVLLRKGDYIQATESGLVIPLLDPFDQLDVPFQSTRFSGEDNEGINGGHVPKLFGNVRRMQASLVGDPDHDFEIHEGADAQIDKVFANGYELEQSTGTAGVWDSDGDTNVTRSSTGTTADESRNSLSVDYDNLAEEPPAFFEFAAILIAVAGSDESEATVSLEDGGSDQDIRIRLYADAGEDVVLTVLEDGTTAWTTSFAQSSASARVGLLFDWANGQAKVYLNSALAGTWSLQSYTGTKTWEIGVDLDVTASTLVEATVAGRFDDEDWEFRPSRMEYPNLRGWGTYGSATIQSSNTFRLVNNPRGSKITVDAAQQSPQGFESWSVHADPGWTISGNESRTVTSTTDDKGGALLPCPRSFGRYVWEIECDAVTGAGVAEMGLTSWNASDTITTRTDTSAHRVRSALVADDGTFRLNNVSQGNIGSFTAGDVFTFEPDHDNDNLRVEKNGSAVSGSPFTITDFARIDAKGTFSATDYYDYLNGGYTTADSQFVTVALRINTATGTGNQTLFQVSSTRCLVRVLDGDKPRLILLNSAGTAIAQYQTSDLSDGWHSILMSADLSTQTVQIYVDDSSDVTTVTAAVDDDIGFSFADSIDVGSSAAAQPCTDVDIQLLGVCAGVAVDLSVEANRRRFFRADGYPSEYAGYDGRGAFGQQPELWIVDGDATNNRGRVQGFTELGTVGDTTAPGDRYTPLTPVVFSDTTGDKFTIRGFAEDFEQGTYTGVAAAERMALNEALTEIAGGLDDAEQNFLDVVNSGFCPTFGYAEMTNGNHRTKKEIVRWLARSYGCGLWWDRDNQLRVLILSDPGGNTADHTLTRDDDVALDDVSYELDRAENLTAKIESWRIWAPHRDGEIATSLSAEAQALIARQNGILSALNTGGLHASYSHVADAEALETLLQDGNPLDTTEQRSGDLMGARAIGNYSRLRGYIRSSDSFLVDVEPGHTINFIINRWSMSAGRHFLVIDADNDDINGRTDLLLWG